MHGEKGSKAFCIDSKKYKDEKAKSQKRRMKNKIVKPDGVMKENRGRYFQWY